MRKFEPTDYLDIVGWFQRRGISAPTRFDLPSRGFIVPDVAAAFLICTDTNSAILDFCISNPDSSKESRAEALPKILNGLIKEATRIGFRKIMASSQLDTIKNIICSSGFDDVGSYRTFVKEL